jgi:hypothetical protein
MVLRRIYFARHTLRQRQCFILFFGGGVGLLLIFLAICIPWSWEWVLLGTAIPESLGIAVVEIIFNRRRKNKSSSSQHGNRDMVASATLTQKEPDAVANVEIVLETKPKRRVKRNRHWRMMLSQIAEESRIPVSEQSLSQNIRDSNAAFSEQSQARKIDSTRVVSPLSSSTYGSASS